MKVIFKYCGVFGNMKNFAARTHGIIFDQDLIAAFDDFICPFGYTKKSFDLVGGTFEQVSGDVVKPTLVLGFVGKIMRFAILKQNVVGATQRNTRATHAIVDTCYQHPTLFIKNKKQVLPCFLRSEYSKIIRS
jgi:hypothetical protein